jgi:hypothetical protein
MNLILKSTRKFIKAPWDLYTEYRDDTLTKEEIKELKDKYAVIQRTWWDEGDRISYDYNVYIRCNTPFETKKAAKEFCERMNLKSFDRSQIRQQVKIVKLSKKMVLKHFTACDLNWRFYLEDLEDDRV